MASLKRSATDPISQPKKCKQLKLDSMITVSPLPNRGRSQTEKEEKKGSEINISSDSQEIVTSSSGSSQNSQNSQTVMRTVNHKLSSALTSTPKTERLARKTPLEVLFSGVTNNYTAKDIFQSDEGKR